MNVLAYILIVLFAALSVCQLPDALSAVTAKWQIFIPVLCGILANYLLSRISVFSKNKEHLRALSHELTHWIVGLMFLRKIHTLNVGERTGYVEHSGGRFGDIFIGLSPYCFPILTIFMLLLRLVIAPDFIWGFDVLVGLSIGFHIGCFSSQIGRHQTDITCRGVAKSYMFIVASWIFFLLLIIFSIRFNIWTAVKLIFVGYWDTLEAFIKIIF
jgi:hypothetical protein